MKSTISIRQAMETLDKITDKCLLVVDEHQVLKGTITDGDIRRSILSGLKFSDSILKCYHKTPVTLINGNYGKEEAINLLRKNGFILIPILDQQGKVVDYVTLSKINGDKKSEIFMSDVSVVIMSGGRGTRMEPFTKVLPKPLIPIHGKPIIEHIVDRFTNIGCKNFYLTINYKGKILKAYFEELKPSYDAFFIEEKNPLGTAGSLHFLKGVFNKPFFVTNCDIIIKENYLSLYKFHQKGGYDITLVASAKEYIIPYGTCELTPDGHLSYINEKPQFDFLINTGLYVLNPDILDLIPKDEFYHITNLIEDAKNQGKKVGVFPIDDHAWVDIGQWAEYKKAIEML